MKNILYATAFSLIMLVPLTAQAATGVCTDDGGVLLVSIMTHDNGNVFDLAFTVDDKKIYRYPEAGLTKVALPAYRYSFTAKKKGNRAALKLDISGKSGSMVYQGKNIALECNWQ